MLARLTANPEDNPKCLVHLKTTKRDTYHVLTLESVVNLLITLKPDPESAAFCSQTICNGGMYSTNILQGIFEAKLYDRQSDEHRVSKATEKT